MSSKSRTVPQFGRSVTGICDICGSLKMGAANSLGFIHFHAKKTHEIPCPIPMSHMSQAKGIPAQS